MIRSIRSIRSIREMIAAVRLVVRLTDDREW